MRRLAVLAGILALAVAAASGIAAGAGQKVVSSGTPAAYFDLSIEPARLPVKELVPVRVELALLLPGGGAGIGPFTRRIRTEFDRAGAINPAPFAACRAGLIEDSGMAEARASCGQAIIGFGTAKIGWDATLGAGRAAIPLTLFYGGERDDVSLVLIHARAPQPLDETFLAKARIGHGTEGSDSLTAELGIPTIADGHGWIESARLKVVPRRLPGEPAPTSFAVARCPRSGAYGATANLFIAGPIQGPIPTVPSTRPCSPRRPPPR